MPSFLERANPLGKHNILSGVNRKMKGFWLGTPEEHERQPTLLPNQIPIQEQLSRAAQEQGAGGAYGTAADYYRNLLSDNPEIMQQLSAPEMRQFREQIMPQLSEQFAGLGAGGLSSSSFRNAQIGAGTDLAERLGAMRAQLRNQGAQGLMNIGQQSLGNYSQDVMTKPGTEGMLAPIAGAATTAFLGPAAGAMGYQAGNWLSNSLKGKSSPYGGVQTQQQQPSNFQMPNFSMRP